MKGEIVETMLVLQVRFMREARGAQIDARDARFPVIEGIARGGIAAATRDQDVEVRPVRPIGPERVPVAFEITPSLRVRTSGASRSAMGNGYTHFSYWLATAPNSGADVTSVISPCDSADRHQ